MKQQDYLDAMGISRWRCRGAQARCVLLCDDPRQVDGHPLVMAVLKLLHIESEQCQVVDQLQAEDRVLWDMRLMNRPHKPKIIYSSPLTQLLKDSDAKRLLWQQIWQLQQSDAVDSIK